MWYGINFPSQVLGHTGELYELRDIPDHENENRKPSEKNQKPL
jgi:hypothetical protein